MARLRLTLHGISCYENGEANDLKPADLSVSTESDTASTFFQVDGSKYGYTLTLTDFSFKKKMYQPTEIQAEIQLTMSAGNTATFIAIGKKALVDLFKSKKVTLEEITPKSSEKDDEVKFTIGDDFYVDEVLPRFKPTSMFVKLKIYSLDHLMTLQHYSRSFVSKKLFGEILSGSLKNYTLPYDKDNCLTAEYTSAKHLFYEVTEKNEKVAREHIFPYLVQYNESFYDFMARTANRWGEFMYYEDGSLQFGYTNVVVKDVTTPTADNKVEYSNITYVDLDSKSDNVPDNQLYNCEGSEEKNFQDDTLRKSPNSVDGILFSPGSKGDKVAMKEISSLLKNEKNLPTFLANRLFDNTYSLYEKKLGVIKDNRDFDETYFPDKDKPASDDHYGIYDFGSDGKEDKDDGYNLFSEINSTYGAKMYAGILKKEFKAAKDAVCIDYNTTCPHLKLGDVIEVYGDDYIVVEISTDIDENLLYKVNARTETVTRVVSASALVFQVIAIRKVDDELFYPTVIPAGHVRYASPQIGTITSADDPEGKNRVRVMIESWQTIEYKDKKKKKGITDQAIKDSSPWLTFATAASGTPVVGKHYQGNKVLVGYVDGNIERPYVLGGLASKGDWADHVQKTPGGHEFTMYDDAEGIKNFLTNMFMPSLGTYTPALSLIPGFSNFKDWILKPSTGDKNNIALGGGFEICDKYGIYKISGSTDWRSVQIASPWGSVDLNAFTGISISAPNGDIEIKGKNVSIEAGNNLSITSGTNVKYKLLGETLDKSAGTIASSFVGNMTAAITKKLLQKTINVIDLSIVRNVLDIFFRPSEGALRIKSNRYLMLESGKGGCDYPADAYKDEKTIQKLFKKQEKSNFRPGLKLSSAVVEMIDKVNVVGNKIDADYRAAYNKCVDLRKEFDEAYKSAVRWSDDYNSNKPEESPKICKTYDDLKRKLWTMTVEPVKLADLEFKENYKLEKADIKPNAIIYYCSTLNNAIYVSDDKMREAIVSLRTASKDKLLKLALKLQKAISDFLKLIDDSRMDIETQFGWWKDRNIPEDFKKALVTAFDKEKLGDTFFYKEIAEDKKELTASYRPNALKTERIILKRKAAIVLLTEMGFKDEWRIGLRDYSHPVAAGNVVAPQAGANGIPRLPAAPAPVVPTLTEVPLKTTEADLVDDIYWANYLQTLEAVPQMSPVQSLAFKEAQKAFNNLKDSVSIHSNIVENLSWGNAKKGAILFSSDENVYQLKNAIDPIAVVGKENLSVFDDKEANGPVSSFLKAMRDKLNSFD